MVHSSGQTAHKSAFALTPLFQLHSAASFVLAPLIQNHLLLGAPKSNKLSKQTVRILCIHFGIEPNLLAIL